MSNMNLDPGHSSKHSDETYPTQNIGEYHYPTPTQHDIVPADPQDDDNDPAQKKSRRRLAVAIGAGVAGLVTGVGVVMGVSGGASNERAPESREPSASAPAVPGVGESERAPSTKESEKTPIDYGALLEDNIEKRGLELETQKKVNFNQPNSKVALDILGQLSDWTMEGATKENVDAWSKDLESPDQLGARELGTHIADEIAEHQLKNPLFASMDQETVDVIKKTHANNLLAYFVSVNNKEDIPYKATLEPAGMTEPFLYNGATTWFKLNRVSNSSENAAGQKYEEDTFKTEIEYPRDVLQMTVDEGKVTRLDISQLPPPAGFMTVEEAQEREQRKAE